MRALVLVTVVLWSALPARADSSADHEALLDAIAADLVAGKPLVVQAHVPLCDNGLIRCGGHGLGDPDAPRTNLYWATGNGFVGWFGRKGSGWTLVGQSGSSGDVAEERVWRRRVTPTEAWKRRGVKRPFEVYVVATAWRGGAIDAAVATWAADLYGDRARPVKLTDGSTIEAGGAAQVVAYVGHNRWMDVPGPRLAELAGSQRPRGLIALACATAPYLAASTAGGGRVPLLMTTDLLFAGAHAFEGTVTAFAEGLPLAAIRGRAAAQYAAGQGRPLGKVSGAFTNPSDRRWSRWLASD